MRIVLLIVVVVLIFLTFKGESVRRYFGMSAEKVESTATTPKPESARPPAENTTGAAPSPGNDPNMHNSPTRRLGF